MHNEVRLLKRALVTLLLIPLASCSLFSRGPSQLPPRDTDLRKAVSHALTGDPSLQDTQIQVQSAGGVIDLSGSVKSLAIKSRAGLVAASVPGVVQVHNDLLTPAGGP